MREPIYNKDDVEQIREDYLVKGLGMETIVKKMGKGSRTSLRKIMVDSGIPIRSIQQSNGRILSQEEEDGIIYNYTILGKGLTNSGLPYKVSQDLVKKTLQRNGIKIRSYQEAKDKLRIYAVNDDYFKTQTHNMAYILGLLASDGNIAKKENRISITLHNRDTEILEKIRQEISLTKPLDFFTTNNGDPRVKLDFHSATIKKDLAHYNIVPAKTYSLKFPSFLQEEYIISYIRGMFDGDGSIGIYQNRVSFSIGGASKEVIFGIRDFLSNKYNIYTTNITSKILPSGKLFYTLSYANKASLQIFKILYIDDSLYMKRKKERFMECIAQRT